MADPTTGDAPTAPQPEKQSHRVAFTYSRYQRARERRGPVMVADHRPRGTPMARANTRIAVFITMAVGSMWCAYLFTVIALISAPSAFRSGDTLVIVSWIAQTFLQLVLLPIIIVGQNVLAQAADARSQQTYDDAEAILHDCMQLQEHLEAQDEMLNHALAHLTKLAGQAT